LEIVNNDLEFTLEPEGKLLYIRDRMEVDQVGPQMNERK